MFLRQSLSSLIVVWVVTFDAEGKIGMIYHIIGSFTFCKLVQGKKKYLFNEWYLLQCPLCTFCWQIGFQSRFKMSIFFFNVEDGSAPLVHFSFCEMNYLKEE
jgi:hypothetical protein